MAGQSDYDVIIAGSGAAGLTTAVVCAHLGLSVLVAEKAAQLGGTTAFSLGAPWIIDNPRQKDLGLDDDAETGRRYLRGLLGNLYDAPKVDAYIESGAEMIAFLEAHGAGLWKGMPMPDYFPEAEGARFGRTMMVEAFNGRVLGRKLRHIRNPLPGFALFGSMQVDMLEAPEMRNAFRTRAGFRLVAGKLLRYGFDLLTVGKGRFLANGNALVGRLYHAALNAGVDVWTQAPVVELLQDGGRVTGAIIERAGRRIEVRARRGVVMASGGFGANEELRRKYIPLADAHVSVQPAENVGDGIRIGEAAGGALGAVNGDNGVWAPVSGRTLPRGGVQKYPHFGPDRAKPGSIIVDGDGRRFMNEAAPYVPFVHRMQERGIRKAFFLGDRTMLRRYGMGLALPAPYPVGRLIRDGYLIEAPTIAALATKLGIDAQTLEQTVADFNGPARDGKDPAFHRGENVYDHSQGDFTHPLNPNVAPLEKPPFYAVILYPGDVSTVFGLDTDADGQVLTDDKTPVGGLYAVGLDQNNFLRGVYAGGGCGIGPGMTFGYRAARHLARTP